MGAAVSNFFGSVMTRLALIFGALAIMTGAAIVVGWLVFQSIAMNMLALSEQKLPDLRNGANVASVADRIRTVLADTLIAPSIEDVNRLNITKSEIIADFRQTVSALDEETANELTPKISAVETALQDLAAARIQNFNSSANVASAVEKVMLQATDATALLAQQTDSAYFNLVIGSDDTISSIDDTLSRLIEEDFALYQSALETRSELNLLSGLALTVSQTRDSAIISILRDLAAASTSRLTKLVPILESSPTTADLSILVSEATAAFSESVSGAGQRITPSEALSVRQSVDAALLSALDDIYFELVIKSDDAKTGNEASIRRLMDVEVTKIRTQATLDSATKSLFAAVMQTALARNPDELSLRSNELSQTASRLLSAMEGADANVIDTLQPMLVIANSESGIVSIRQAAFDANARTKQATQSAAASVREITTSIDAYTSATQLRIEETAEMLKDEVSAAGVRMQNIGIASVVLVMIAPLLIWKMVTAPLNHVTRVTERLANGDLAEITGLDRKSGEIARMAKALKVFREGALERIEMQKEERKLQEERQKAKLAAERAERDAADKERTALAAREAEDRAREEKEQKRIEEARRATEDERQARVEEQEAVVSKLAAGLKYLSEGDFTRKIETTFPGSYETLRQDYNAAIENLAELIRKIGHSAGMIDASSSEIASSSLDLSRRTESSAATLEETSAALSQLTVSVSSAANGASTASETVESVKRDAESGQTVMHEAVTAMSQIEQSAAKISEIVEVIDSISFQTNLLALNAGVEAARAGDAGRGFAVVASEVRILAHRCSEAALQINALISESEGHVENGVSMIDQTNKALENILMGITDVSKNVSEIAVSAHEQSGGIKEINTAVEQLDHSTQQNAAMFEETTAASQTLTNEASDLTRIVAGFVVPKVTSADEQSQGSSLAGKIDQAS